MPGLTPEQLAEAQRIAAQKQQQPGLIDRAMNWDPVGNWINTDPVGRALGTAAAPAPVAAPDAFAGQGGSSQANPYDVPPTAQAQGAGGGSADRSPPVVPSEAAYETDRGAAAYRAPATPQQPAPEPEPEAAPQQPPAPPQGGGYSPATVIPGGPRVAGWNVTEQRGPQTPYELRQAYSDSMGQLQDAGRKQAEIEGQRAAFSAEVAQQNAEAEKRFLAEQARIRQASDKAAATDRVQSSAEMLGTGGLIGAALLMGLGEYAARRPGGSGVNTAKALIDKGIDQEMQRQAKAIDIRRMGREEQALRLANMRVSYYEVMKQKVAAKSAELGTEEAAINGQKLIAGLDLEHNKYETDAARLAMGHTQVATSIQNVAPRMVGGGGPAKPKSEDKELMVPGYGVALTKKDADDAKEAIASYNELAELGKRLKASTETWTDRVSPEKRAQAAALSAKMLTTINRQSKAGALDAGSLPIIQSQIGGITDVTDFGGRTAALDATLDMARQGLAKGLEAKGLTPARQSVEQGPNGPRVAVNLTGEQPLKPAASAKNIRSFRTPEKK